MDRQTLKKVLMKFYSQYQWILKEDGLVWQDDAPQPTIEELNSKVEQLQATNLKTTLITEITHFFDITARIMMIKNGKTQPIIANGEMRENLRSAIIQAEQSGGTYIHHLTDGNNEFIIQDGKTVDIVITSDELKQVNEMINVRSGLCYVAKNYHLSRLRDIISVDELIQYKEDNCYILNAHTLKAQTVWRMCNGVDYIPPQEIQIVGVAT
jgi:hypothetical protein